MFEKIKTTWGKVGVASLMLAAFAMSMLGYAFSPEDQAAMFELIMAGITGIGSIWAIILKVQGSK